MMSTLSNVTNDMYTDSVLEIITEATTLLLQNRPKDIELALIVHLVQRAKRMDGYSTVQEELQKHIGKQTADTTTQTFDPDTLSSQISGAKPTSPLATNLYSPARPSHNTNIHFICSTARFQDGLHAPSLLTTVPESFLHSPHFPFGPSTSTRPPVSFNFFLESLSPQCVPQTFVDQLIDNVQKCHRHLPCSDRSALFVYAHQFKLLGEGIQKFQQSSSSLLEALWTVHRSLQHQIIPDSTVTDVWRQLDGESANLFSWNPTNSHETLFKDAILDYFASGAGDPLYESYQLYQDLNQTIRGYAERGYPPIERLEPTTILPSLTASNFSHMSKARELEALSNAQKGRTSPFPTSNSDGVPSPAHTRLVSPSSCHSSPSQGSHGSTDMQIQAQLDYYSPFIRELCSSLESLPQHRGIVFRGTAEVMNPDAYRVGEYICWPGFSSATSEVSVAKYLLGHPKSDLRLPGTLFVIHSLTGRNISSFSPHPNECEILFSPNTCFSVEAVDNDERAAILASFGWRMEHSHYTSSTWSINLPKIIKLKEIQQDDLVTFRLAQQAATAWNEGNFERALELYEICGQSSTSDSTSSVVNLAKAMVISYRTAQPTPSSTPSSDSSLSRASSFPPCSGSPFLHEDGVATVKFQEQLSMSPFVPLTMAIQCVPGSKPDRPPQPELSFSTPFYSPVKLFEGDTSSTEPSISSNTCMATRKTQLTVEEQEIMQDKLEALQYFAAGLLQSPSHPMLLQHYGLALHYIGDNPSAALSLSKAIQLDGSSWTSVGNAVQMVGEQHYLQRIAEGVMNNQLASSQYQLSLGCTSLARDCAKAALCVLPTSKDALEWFKHVAMLVAADDPSAKEEMVSVRNPFAYVRKQIAELYDQPDQDWPFWKLLGLLEVKAVI
eukprot:TRINITY_DN59468_c0_g1_i1.p1 TRINITY_DN59468_c0_g1~~TRINITY_DN59468_c0_g1_i1.p1  ORF type:complete len:894 (+),score=69.38 TRINITY_DN59468_c0_g1_i1:252-2933(+)